MDGLCALQSLGRSWLFPSQLPRVSTVDSEIPSLHADWVRGHREDLGIANAFSPVDLLKLASGGKTYKILKIPGGGSSSVTH